MISFAPSAEFSDTKVLNVVTRSSAFFQNVLQRRTAKFVGFLLDRKEAMPNLRRLTKTRLVAKKSLGFLHGIAVQWLMQRHRDSLVESGN